ncbi:MAG: hypothetical protein HRU43_01035 [Simkaniaceae bacterium]|nr:hypothetical protein [Simkaniaceae bacterium]
MAIWQLASWLGCLEYLVGAIAAETHDQNVLVRATSGFVVGAGTGKVFQLAFYKTRSTTTLINRVLDTNSKTFSPKNRMVLTIQQIFNKSRALRLVTQRPMSLVGKTGAELSHAGQKALQSLKQTTKLVAKRPQRTPQAVQKPKKVYTKPKVTPKTSTQTSHIADVTTPPKQKTHNPSICLEPAPPTKATSPSKSKRLGQHQTHLPYSKKKFSKRVINDLLKPSLDIMLGKYDIRDFGMMIHFSTLEKKCNPTDNLFLEVKKIFKNFIEPVYGNQQNALEKIRVGEDRRCEVLYCNEQVEGILVYKSKNSDEYSDFGISNALELKTLILTQKSNKFSGLFVSILYKQIGLAALEYHSSCIVSTVSSEKAEAFNVAKKLGFIKVHSLKGKNVQGVDESLVCHKNPLELITNADRIINLHKNTVSIRSN